MFSHERGTLVRPGVKGAKRVAGVVSAGVGSGVTTPSVKSIRSSCCIPVQDDRSDFTQWGGAGVGRRRQQHLVACCGLRPVEDPAWYGQGLGASLGIKPRAG